MQRLISVGVQAAATALLASACYSYVPHADPVAPRGDEVRIHLSPAGSADLARDIGPRMASIDARIIQVGQDSSLTLAVSQLRSMRGEPIAWQGDAPLLVPRSAIALVERRQLSRGRTVVASTAAAAAVAALGVIAVRRAGEGSGTGGTQAPPPP